MVKDDLVLPFDDEATLQTQQALSAPRSAKARGQAWGSASAFAGAGRALELVDLRQTAAQRFGVQCVVGQQLVRLIDSGPIL